MANIGEKLSNYKVVREFYTSYDLIEDYYQNKEREKKHTSNVKKIEDIYEKYSKIITHLI